MDGAGLTADVVEDEHGASDGRDDGLAVLQQPPGGGTRRDGTGQEWRETDRNDAAQYGMAHRPTMTNTLRCDAVRRIAPYSRPLPGMWASLLRRDAALK